MRQEDPRDEDNETKGQGDADYDQGVAISVDDDKGLVASTDDNSDENTPFKHGHGHGYTGPTSWGRGIVAEIRATVGTWWCKEMTNFNQKTIAVSFFIYFAAMAPAITFGAVYAKSTNNFIGPVEMIAATAWVGIVYALIGGQPMMINGGTGPVLAFTAVLYQMSQTMDIPFLALNGWTGLWVCFFLVVSGVFDWNRVMKHATRFTDEIFAMLIAFIFILDAIGNPLNPVGLYWYFRSDHKSHNELRGDDPESYNHIATAFLSAILGLGTTGLAFFLRGIRNSPFFFHDRVRSIISDFAVVASIAFWTFFKNVIFADVPTERLNVPDSFAPTLQCCDATCRTSWPDDCLEQSEPWGRRPWFVDLGDLNGKVWVPFFAIVPAMLGFILVFLDDGITWHLINHPSNKLTHGEAYNWDSVLIGITIGVNSIVGLPWLVAATVRSLTHVHALAEHDKNGKILSVQETRLTNFFIHVLVLASIFILRALKVIPVPVLYGVFLFMGVASLSSNQFWRRFTMFFMQPSKYPKEVFTEYLPAKRMHIFTGIQVALFISLMVFRSISIIAIAFPIVIKACIPIRMYILPRFFTQDELTLLDSGDDDEIQEVVNRLEGEKKIDAKGASLDGEQSDE